MILFIIIYLIGYLLGYAVFYKVAYNEFGKPADRSDATFQLCWPALAALVWFTLIVIVPAVLISRFLAKRLWGINQ